MRLPWQSPNREFSYTTFWLNIACLVIVARLLVGAGLTVGTFSWQPGEMDAALATGILAVFSGLYWGRRKQDVPSDVPKAPVTP